VTRVTPATHTVSTPTTHTTATAAGIAGIQEGRGDKLLAGGRGGAVGGGVRGWQRECTVTGGGAGGAIGVRGDGDKGTLRCAWRNTKKIKKKMNVRSRAVI